MAVIAFPKWEHVVGWWNWSVSSSKTKENKNHLFLDYCFHFFSCLIAWLEEYKAGGWGECGGWAFTLVISEIISTGILKPSVKSYCFPLAVSTLEGNILAPGLALQNRKDAVPIQ